MACESISFCDNKESIEKCLNCAKPKCNNCLQVPDKWSRRTTNRRIDLTGQRFGAWTVLEPAGPTNKTNTSAFWMCRCDCGTVKSVASNSLRRGVSTGCAKCRHIRKKAVTSDG